MRGGIQFPQAEITALVRVVEIASSSLQMQLDSQVVVDRVFGELKIDLPKAQV